MGRYATPEEEWQALLEGSHPHLRHGSPLRFLPAAPRCRLCRAPFRAPGALLLRRYGFKPWEKNPNICGRCFKGMETQARSCPASREDGEVSGAEVEISMLFADVRGSSRIARTMPVLEFSQLMNRFYRISSHVLFEHDAIVEKFVGDEVVGLFVPLLAGKDHARRAVDTAEALLRATGHGTPEGPWAPLGVGVHTGTAFVGVVSSEGTGDFTALGDPMNVAAHLSAQAGIGEILVTTEAASAASLSDGFERRSLSLKGHAVNAVVLGPTDLSARTD